MVIQASAIDLFGTLVQVRYNPGIDPLQPVIEGQKLDSDRLNRWLTLAANVGVLAGIVLLIAELDQNRDMIRSQTRNEIARETTVILGLSAGNPLLAEVLEKANTGGTLNSTEAHMVRARNEIVLRHWENVHYQYRQGLYEHSEFDAELAAYAEILSRQPALVDQWCRDSKTYSAEFSEQLESLLPPGTC